MQGTILLNYNENVKQVESEEKNKFLRNLLLQSGIPEEELWEESEALSIEGKIKIRNFLAKWHVQVIDDLDGHMSVYYENKLIGEWFKCTYILKRDLREIDRKKQLYMEMNTNFWTIFEEQEKK